MKTELTRTVLLILTLAAPAAGVPPVHYEAGKVTAHLDGADPAEVLREVGRQAGLEIRGTPTESRPLHVQLDAVPLADALPRLLGGQSFLLVYRGGHVSGVRLLGSSDAENVFVAAAPAPGMPAAPDEEVVETGSLAASHRAIAIGGRLARAVGADQTSFSDIMGVAMRDPDSRVRADALRVGLRIVDAEPELQADLLLALDAYDDAFLAGWLERAAGPHAQEVARRAAHETRNGSLRTRAQRVEKLLRTSAGD